MDSPLKTTDNLARVLTCRVRKSAQGRRPVRLIKQILTPVLVGGLFVYAPLTTHATPTGLNNIPTADVVPEKVLVFQGFGFFANDARPDWWGGFKYGLWENLEVGFDAQLNPDPSDDGALAGQVNYRLSLWEDGAVGLGVANIGDDDRNGEVDPYAVLTHDFGFLRAHVGGTFQEDNEGVFAGLDKTVPLFERNFTFRADLRQTNERDDLLSSAGFIYDLGHNLLLETWGSFPSESDGDDVLTVKMNYVIPF